MKIYMPEKIIVFNGIVSEGRHSASERVLAQSSDQRLMQAYGAHLF
jgi:hypothetical protein